MQPHYPFIGPTGQDYFDLESLAFWDRVESGEIPVSNTIIEQAYEENLDVALPYVKELLEELAGKTVVTSDHGQMLGERAGILPRTYYGHPPGLYHPTLVGIPWLVQNSQPRREIYAEEPTEREDVDADETTVQERLNQLGYA